MTFNDADNDIKILVIPESIFKFWVIAFVAFPYERVKDIITQVATYSLNEKEKKVLSDYLDKNIAVLDTTSIKCWEDAAALSNVTDELLTATHNSNNPYMPLLTAIKNNVNMFEVFNDIVDPEEIKVDNSKYVARGVHYLIYNLNDTVRRNMLEEIVDAFNYIIYNKESTKSANITNAFFSISNLVDFDTTDRFKQQLGYEYKMIIYAGGYDSIREMFDTEFGYCKAYNNREIIENSVLYKYYKDKIYPLLKGNSSLAAAIKNYFEKKVGGYETNFIIEQYPEAEELYKKISSVIGEKNAVDFVKLLLLFDAIRKLPDVSLDKDVVNIKISSNEGRALIKTYNSYAKILPLNIQLGDDEIPFDKNIYLQDTRADVTRKLLKREQSTHAYTLYKIAEDYLKNGVDKYAKYITRKSINTAQTTEQEPQDTELQIDSTIEKIIRQLLEITGAASGEELYLQIKDTPDIAETLSSIIDASSEEIQRAINYLTKKYES